VKKKKKGKKEYQFNITEKPNCQSITRVNIWCWKGKTEIKAQRSRGPKNRKAQ